MRMRKKMIDYVAEIMTQNLRESGLLTIDIPAETVTMEIRRLITEDLMVEDRLNDEVKEILRSHTDEIDRGNIDYSRMFTMVKRKLVQERGLIL